MNGELLSILEAIERDRGVDREILIQAVEAALVSAAKKNVGRENKEVTVTIDRKTGRIVVTSDDQELSSTTEFSRIAAQTAKQVIIQKIREAEREVIFGEFQGKVGDIVTGSVHRFERGDVIVDLGRVEAILPKMERIPHEEFQQGDRLQGYVLEVRKSARGAEIILSRVHEGFIRGLFALEVPEINEKIVGIKAIAREAGDRTKIAVSSKDEKVDCVGACVGIRGTRVKNIVRELHGEKVDIIRWQEAIGEFIGSALSPAKIAEIRPDLASQQALVIVEDDQLSLAIGKKGQNVRLASKLTGWQLEIKSKSQLAAEAMELSKLPGVGPAMQERLKQAGIASVQQLAQATLEQLTGIKGIGGKTAQKLLDAAKQTLEQASAPKEDVVHPEEGAPPPGEDVPPPGGGETTLPEAIQPEEKPEIQPQTEAPQETQPNVSDEGEGSTG